VRLKTVGEPGDSAQGFAVKIQIAVLVQAYRAWL
jgi:hypothetical protein